MRKEMKKKRVTERQNANLRGEHTQQNMWKKQTKQTSKKKLSSRGLLKDVEDHDPHLLVLPVDMMSVPFLNTISMYFEALQYIATILCWQHFLT